MKDIGVGLTAAIVIVAGIVFLSFLFAWPVKELWNGCLVDAITGVKEITWLQAWGLSALCGLLFKPIVSSK